jgi:hypothetical protein
MYQVLIVSRPADWRARQADDVPPALQTPLEVAGEWDDLWKAQEAAVAYNQEPQRRQDLRWAVVGDGQVRSRRWAGPRLCTPLAFKVAALVRPESWEPASPWDVPNCIAKAERQGAGVELSRRQALGTVWALNQQSMDQADTTWFVAVAVENEPSEESVRYDPAGHDTVMEVRPLHVVRPPNGGRGDCSYCPARDLPCRDAERTPLIDPEVTHRP